MDGAGTFLYRNSGIQCLTPLSNSRLGSKAAFPTNPWVLVAVLLLAVLASDPPHVGRLGFMATEIWLAHRVCSGLRGYMWDFTVC